MKSIGNILWFFFGGLLSGAAWCITGALWCVTIIGIPIGVQCFKLSAMSFFPFGKQIVYRGGVMSTLVNFIWFLCGGILLALLHFIIGLLWCATIIGIPFGLQFFKLGKLALAPFGAEIVPIAETK